MRYLITLVDDELYRDVVEKFGGDHKKAAYALVELGLLHESSAPGLPSSKLPAAERGSIYQDLLVRSKGDHVLARAAMRQLDLHRLESPGRDGMSGRTVTALDTMGAHSASTVSLSQTGAHTISDHATGTGGTGALSTLATPRSTALGSSLVDDDMLYADIAPPFYVCPVSSIVMRDPVVLTTERTYERRAIEYHLRIHPNICPASRRPIEPPVTITPDVSLRQNIEAWSAVHAPRLLVRLDVM